MHSLSLLHLRAKRSAWAKQRDKERAEKIGYEQQAEDRARHKLRDEKKDKLLLAQTASAEKRTAEEKARKEAAALASAEKAKQRREARAADAEATTRCGRRATQPMILAVLAFAAVLVLSVALLHGVAPSAPKQDHCTATLEATCGAEHSDVFKCDEPPASPAAEGLDSPNGFTSAGPPQGSTVLGPRVTAPGVQDDSGPPASAKSLRFSDQCIVRTYSLESLERSLSFADVALLDTAKDLAMKRQDGPSEAARLVDLLVRMLFNNKPRTVRELRGLLGPERCEEVTNAADAVAERFANLQERLLDMPEGGCIAMLPSNSKLQKQHVPWIEQLAQWATQLAPPPQRVHSKRRGGPSACCGARTAE